MNRRLCSVAEDLTIPQKMSNPHKRGKLNGLPINPTRATLLVTHNEPEYTLSALGVLAVELFRLEPVFKMCLTVQTRLTTGLARRGIEHPANTPENNQSWPDCPRHCCAWRSYASRKLGVGPETCYGVGGQSTGKEPQAFVYSLQECLKSCEPHGYFVFVIC